MASPALAALAARRERFNLTLLAMFPSVMEYLRDQGFTDDVRLIKFINMPKLTILRHAIALRQERFDISVIPYAMNRLGYNILNFVVGARLRVGFRYQRQALINFPQLNQCVIDEKTALHGVEENLRWAAIITGRDAKTMSDDLHYISRSEADRAAEEFLCAQVRGKPIGPLIGIHAACNSLKNQHRRCWPARRFGRLIEQMAAGSPNLTFLLFEGPDDAEINKLILANVTTHRDRVIVASSLPMRVVGALMRHCQLFLSNDSGLMHAAAACRVPCVSIFGPTNPTWVHPWKTHSVIVSQHLPCSPCFYYSSRPLTCPANLDFACVREISVDEVFKAIQNLLAGTDEKNVSAKG